LIRVSPELEEENPAHVTYEAIGPREKAYSGNPCSPVPESTNTGLDYPGLSITIPAAGLSGNETTPGDHYTYGKDYSWEIRLPE
jgi:hypothetical protein